MLSKWLHRPSRHDGNEALSGQSGETPVSSGGKNAASESGNDARPRVNRQDATGLKPRGDLLPLEDIYRAKGITGLRMGYSIHKVVEMLTSNHVRELSNEMKRASVLMALDVAGIPLDEVLNDAKRRLEALNSYESDQEQHLADYEVRKVQENNEIQLEMERITAHYLERLKRNVDEIALVRSPFANWQAMKQQETQRISEAVELCTNQIASESRNTSPSAVQTLSVVRQPAAPVSGKMSRA